VSSDVVRGDLRSLTARRLYKSLGVKVLTLMGCKGLCSRLDAEDDSFV
jgi:hypothetical protein